MRLRRMRQKLRWSAVWSCAAPVTAYEVKGTHWQMQRTERPINAAAGAVVIRKLNIAE